MFSWRTKWKTINALDKRRLNDSARQIRTDENTFEPPHDKTKKWHVHPAKSQINLDIRPDEKVKLLDQKLLLLEKQDRKYNLLFCGIPEVPDERLYDKMRRFFVTDLKTAQERAQIIHFVNGHRYPTKGDGPKPIIILVLSQAKNLLKAKKRILTDLSVLMNIERGRIAKIAYKIRRQEEIQTRIKEKGLDLYLEVRNRKTDPWVRREIDEDDSGAVKD